LKYPIPSFLPFQLPFQRFCGELGLTLNPELTKKVLNIFRFD
jgi:hypothetical protein